MDEVIQVKVPLLKCVGTAMSNASKLVVFLVFDTNLQFSLVLIGVVLRHIIGN